MIRCFSSSNGWMRSLRARPNVCRIRQRRPHEPETRARRARNTRSALWGLIAKPVNRLNVILAAVLQSLPQFVTRFKNTNLLTAGLRMLATIPGPLGDLRGALRDFKRASDKQAAQAALARLSTAAASLQQSTNAAFQKEFVQ